MPRPGGSALGTVDPAPGPRSPPLPADVGRCADRAAPEQSGRTDHLGTQPGAARARQRIEREIPGQTTHPDPRRNRHGEDGSRVGGAPCTLHHTALCPSGRSWPLPPPRGMQRVYRGEVLRIRIPFQASSQNTLTLWNPPLTSRTEPLLDLLQSLLPAYSAPLRCRSPRHSPLTSLPSPGPSLFTVQFLYLPTPTYISLYPTK